MNITISHYEEVTCSIEEVQDAARRLHEELDVPETYQTLLVANLGGGSVVCITVFDDNESSPDALSKDDRTRRLAGLFGGQPSFHGDGLLVFQRGL